MSNNFLGGFGVANKPLPGGSGGPFFFAVTLAQLQALIASNTIVPGATYQVTDLSDGLGIFLKGLQPNQVSNTGYRLQYLPITYQTVTLNGFDWKGVYNPGAYALNDIVIWGNRVWRNISGAAGSIVDQYTLSAADWFEEPVTNNIFYGVFSFGIVYDIDSNWIALQWDEYNNVAGIAFPVSGSYTFNPVDRTDWNYTTDKTVTNNRWYQFLNNVGSFTLISDNYVAGDVINNNVSNNIIYNYVEGTINNNLVVSIASNKINGLGINNNISNTIRSNYSTEIANNTVTNEIAYNRVEEIRNNTTTDISFNECFTIRNNNVTGQITTNIVEIDITNNTIPGSIQNNYAQQIFNNTNQGNIILNIVPESINANSNTSSISSNKCFSINNNNNTGDITANENNGAIVNNSNNGSINNNRNNGQILNNSNTGNINFNLNNGPISGIGAATTNITQNINNGFIIVTIPGVISDPVVNK